MLSSKRSVSVKEVPQRRASDWQSDGHRTAHAALWRAGEAGAWTGSRRWVVLCNIRKFHGKWVDYSLGYVLWIAPCTPNWALHRGGTYCNKRLWASRRSSSAPASGCSGDVLQAIQHFACIRKFKKHSSPNKVSQSPPTVSTKASHAAGFCWQTNIWGNCAIAIVFLLSMTTSSVYWWGFSVFRVAQCRTKRCHDDSAQWAPASPGRRSPWSRCYR